MSKDFDQRVGARIVRLRQGGVQPCTHCGRGGEPLSQQALAAAMTRAGHGWSQSTIWALERGDRALKLEEAITLGRIFDLDPDDIASLGNDD